MEFTFGYQEDHIPKNPKFPQGTISRPYALISLTPRNGAPLPLTVLVDSGADVTILPLSIGTALGYDVKQGVPFPLSGIGKGTLETYLHEIEGKVGDHKFRMLVAFAGVDQVEGQPVRMLLGRTSIFDVFDVVFKQRSMQTCFARD